MGIPVLDRLAARSRQDGECVVWTGFTNPMGYGHITVDGHNALTHRAAWTARHGEPPPETPCVLHRCDNPPCWADEHLFLGTIADNNADRKAKGRNGVNGLALRTHCPRNHEYDQDNTFVNPNGSRRCRACDREKHRERALANA